LPPAKEQQAAARKNEEATQNRRDGNHPPSFDNHSLVAHSNVILLPGHKDTRMNEPRDTQQNEKCAGDRERSIFHRRSTCLPKQNSARQRMKNFA
jgi:hypothetical protein